jgi:endoglucanase
MHHRFLTPLLVLVAAARLCAAAPDSAPQTLHRFDKPLLFTYGSWKDKLTVEDGRLIIRTANAQGGGGDNVTLDLHDQPQHSPAIRLVIGSANQTKRLRLTLNDRDKRSSAFLFALDKQPTGQPLVLTPIDGAALDQPNETKAPADLSQITQIQLQGDWGKDAVDVEVHEILLVPPTAELTAARQAKAKKDAEALAKAQAEKAKARREIKHTAQSPKIVHVGAVDRDILGITIEDGVLQRANYQPYSAQPGDTIVDADGQVWVDMNGVIERRPQKRVLKRKVDGKDREVGLIAGGRDGKLYLLPAETVAGDRLQLLTVDDPQTYTLTSSDDPAFATAIAPTAVHRKTKPTNRAYPGNDQTLRHTIYLKLPSPLIDGKRYTIGFPYLNTDQPSITYTHDTRGARSEAIHSQHVGYRPDDPFKRAFLSIWLGTGGGHTYANLSTFELIDTGGKTVHTGAIELVLPADGKEKIRFEKNLSHTAVYAMDFSAVTTPGEYRVHVPGIGVSYPITIGRETWQGAFRKSMHGFLAQRSGIALGPPFTDFVRPRDLHPGDGVRVFQSNTSMEAAYSGKSWFDGLVDGRTDQTLDGGWGGYHDAGDFDRASNHLWATYLHLELLELFPAYFEQLKLALPPDEAGDALPDVLNEAMWNIGLFQRLQQADGGVSGGIESSSHPRPGEASHVDSLLLLAYAPDTGSSYAYAAVAGRAAHVMRKYDASRADELARSAVRAFEWAEAHRAASTGKGYMGLKVDDARNAAAVELLRLTKEAKYDAIFKKTTKVTGDANLIEQQGAAFLYARLPEGLGDAGLKQQCRQRLLGQADKALEYASGNAFGLTADVKDMPLIGPVGAFTTPGMNSQILPRAHYLSRDEKYLAGAVRACNFSLGANPDNMTMTTGVGFAAPRAPLHFDSRFTGQEAPAGLTLYGAYDADSLPGFAKGNDWVHTWHIGKTMVPNSRTWPATEFYVDFFLWPMMNELTIKQTMGPTSYYWGYLAARP